MDTLILMVVCIVGYLVAYHTYGRFLARKIFKLDSKVSVPSIAQQDGIDYIPAKRGIVFGHHFTSIAGTGPIVGPAIGIIWGWLPAVLWIMLGSIFMGAVHDFGALVVSLRHEGKSLSEVAARYINPRVRFIFFAIVFLALLIVIAIFGVVIAVVFNRYPESVLPVWLEIPIAMILGWAVYKKSANVTLATFVAVATMYLTVGVGALIEYYRPGLFLIPAFKHLPPTGSWTIILLIYAWIASTLPVNMLLQPRDYINAWQLFVAMALLIVGIIVTACQGQLPLVAPAINDHLTDTPSLWPFLFVTIACGAISGFHSLVASGTSSKQLANETDSQMVGYGSMLMEGLLAILVIICVGAGIGIAYHTSSGEILTGTEAWRHHYGLWSNAQGLGAKLDAFVTGAANIIEGLKLPHLASTAVMGVFVASFAGTTLDTTVRLQRYVISEVANDLRLTWLTNRWTATTLAVLTGAGLAFATGANGKGAMTLWPLFGAVNQLLAALALLVVTLYLKSKEKWGYWITGIPCIIMLTITGWAMVMKEKDFIAMWNNVDPDVKQQGLILMLIGGIVFVLAAWMTVESLLTLRQRSKNR